MTHWPTASEPEHHGPSARNNGDRLAANVERLEAALRECDTAAILPIHRRLKCRKMRQTSLAGGSLIAISEFRRAFNGPRL